jgi:hypothetical protein
MTFKDNTLLRSEGVFYPAIFKEVKKNATPMQPFFEAFTNSLEAIAQLKSKQGKGQITVKLHYDQDLFANKGFNKIIIEDTGIGFNDVEFRRFLTYKDDRKGFHNRGSGRLQLLHAFDTCEYESVFEQDGKYFERKFHVSARPAYLLENAIAYLEYTREVNPTRTGTTLTLLNLKNPKDVSIYNITLSNLKDIILAHYIEYLCAHRETLPLIQLQTFVKNEFEGEEVIEEKDIPQIDKYTDFELPYEMLSPEGKRFVVTDHKETFTIKSFRIPKFKLDKNEIKLTSKEEIVESNEFKVNINVLSADDHIENERYLFLVSSPFIDQRDQDIRGDLRIHKRENYKKAPDMFREEEIFLDEIEAAANKNIIEMYSQIKEKTEEKLDRIRQLKDMFLLNDEFLKDIAISVNDSEEKVLEKVYSAESKQIARGDAEIKRHIDSIANLDPGDNLYEKRLREVVDKLVKEIPHQNRAALTHYVARRKLVLEIYDKILKRSLSVQQSGRNEDEKLLHNLLFKQRTATPDASDLWVLNEDFILFKGTSESQLMDIRLNGAKIFKEELSEEEDRYVKSLGLNRLKKRPDVVLFPDEGKCVILEFKTPEVNISEHLNEINNYASLILNLTKPEFSFDTFYGYLIGEGVEPDDVRFNDGDFKHSHHFNYVFRPAKTIVGRFKQGDGSLYTEVLKYSTLWERANKRNEVFIKKLFDMKTAEQETKRQKELLVGKNGPKDDGLVVPSL